MTVGCDKRIACAEDLERVRAEIRARRDPATKTVRVCIGPGCAARGANKVLQEFRAAVAAAGAPVTIETKGVGCHGLCQRGPIVLVDPVGIFYQQVSPGDVPVIFRESVLGDGIVERLLYEDPTTRGKVLTPDAIPFYQAQQRIALDRNGVIDPGSMEDYLAGGGYAGLAKALRMDPDAVIREVETAGLRGRGGGGFPTARKWRSCRDAPGAPKYVICNGDEGDPGAFMDRAVMEGNPHAIIEGMIIGSHAIGSNHGFIYVRNEYPLSVKCLTAAIAQARAWGFLGEDILGSGHAFDVRINRGGGAFVCGESTALMASLEGRVGEPRAKYVHTVEFGFRDKPTNLNNVETWANVPAIITRGGAWFASIGTPGSKGTKVFSLVGQVANTGLVEVPMGMTLRQIIYGIGGGVKNGRAFKAVQTGGPSGGCIPAEHLDAPVDFDELTRLGSMMGSGGMIVMDEDTCMVSVARYFLNFLREESCGKCTSCREGLAQMLHILDRITHGKAAVADLERLYALADLLAGTALCALGKTAANPVLSTLRYFRGEYEAHITEKRCPARVCKALLRYSIIAETCKGCGICKKNCPVHAITGERKQPHVIDPSRCTRCGLCLEKCPFSAVRKE